MKYIDRTDAGFRLGKKLKDFEFSDAIVVGLARGGIIIGYELAKTLGVAFDFLVVRKIGSPFNDEFGIGAITSDNFSYIDQESVIRFSIPYSFLQSKTKAALINARNLEAVYKKILLHSDLENRSVIIADDGIATSVSVLAAYRSVKAKKPKEIILAVTGGPIESIEKLKSVFDKVIYLTGVKDFKAVGQLYKSFDQVTDNEILLKLRDSGFKK